MAKLEKRNLTRVNMNLPTKIVDKVKDYAEELGLPITQAYTVLINYALEYKDTIKLLPDILKGISDLKDMSNDIENDLSDSVE